MATTRRRAGAPIVGAALIALLSTSALWADLLVSSHGTDEVLRYDDNGNFLGPFVAAHYDVSPNGIGIGPDGHFYVVSTATDSVRRYDRASGAFLGTFAQLTGSFFNPDDLAFGPGGDLFVSALDQNYPPDVVLRYDGATGAPKGIFTSGASLNYPAGLRFGPDGHLHVSSFNFGSLQQVTKYDGQTGVFIMSITGGELNDPRGLTFGPDGDLFVVSRGNARVLRFDSINGAFKGIFASGGGLLAPTGLTFGPGGDLYISDSEGDRALRFDGTTGAFEGVFASGGGLDDPRYLLFATVPEPACQLLPASAAVLHLLRRRRAVP